MAWTTPVDQATGFLVTAAVYNAQIIDNLAYLHGDAGASIDLTAGGQALIASANYLGTSDTRLLRAGQAGLASLLSNPAGDGNLMLGYTTATIAALPTTYTPGARRLINRANVTATGTLTIAAPADTPAANSSGVIYLIIQNASGGAITLTYNAVYINVAATPAAGLGSLQQFVYNPATAKWVGLPAVTGVAQ